MDPAQGRDNEGEILCERTKRDVVIAALLRMQQPDATRTGP